MLIIQLTGLSGAGKSTISEHVKNKATQDGLAIEIIDGDFYRKTICKDLGFSREDRCENIRRLGALAFEKGKHYTAIILAVINPFEEIRNELREKYNAKTVFIECDLDTLIERDTKGLYKRALLPDGSPQKLENLTGVNDTYDIPLKTDLILHTGKETIDQSAEKLYRFIVSTLNDSIEL